MSHDMPRFAVDRSYFGADGSEETLPRLWGRRGFWQIRLRWAVAPLMIAGVLVGRALGFGFETLPILLIALASLVYNALLRLGL